jgi:hypothetical protein
MEMAKRQFFYCLVDWEGLEDAKGKALKCNDDNKKMVYDYVSELRDFILQKAISFSKDIDEEVKN